MKLSRSGIAVIMFFALMVILGMYVFLFSVRPEGVEYPVQRKLTDIQMSPAKTSFVVPDGSTFNFVVGIPKGAEVKTSLRGTIRVLHQDEEVYSVSFNSEQLMASNWLDAYGLQGYILTWQDANRLDCALRAGETYSVEISIFEMDTASSISLWLGYLQRKSRGDNTGHLSQ